jgi:hypothetical protein
MNGPLNTVGIASNTGLRAVERYEVIQQESRVSTAVFASSPALVCTIAASERLVFECLFLWQGPNTGTIKFTFATPATPATGGYVAVDGGAAPVGFGLATGFNGGGGSFVTGPFGTTADVDVTLVAGTLVNGPNPGQFAFQWAQGVANATASVLMPGSYMNIWRR